jgi:hypothetical protein
MMEATVERLTPVHDRDPAHPTLKLELWWVQNVHGTAHGIELPNPIILNERWANDLLAAAASTYAVLEAQKGRESRLWVGRVARQFEGNQDKPLDPHIRMKDDREKMTVSRDGERVLFNASTRDDLGLLAQAARTTFVADIYAHKLREDPAFAKLAPADQGSAAESLLDGRQLTWVEPIELQVDEGADVAEKMRLWIATCRAAASKARLAVRRVVIFDANATTLRGALLGEQKDAAELLPYLRLERDIALGLLEEGVPLTGKTASLAARIGAAPYADALSTPASP